MKKPLKILLLTSAFLLTSCTDSPIPSESSSNDATSSENIPSIPEEKRVTSVTITNKVATLKVGEVLSLNTNVLPADATNKILNYESSDKRIASVDFNGSITARRVGTATIKAISDDNPSIFDELTINVVEASVNSFKAEFADDVEIVTSTTNSFYKLIVGESYPLKVTFDPETSTPPELEASFNGMDGYVSFDSKTNTLTALQRIDSLTVTLGIKGTMIQSSFLVRVANKGEKDIQEVIKKIRNSKTLETEKTINHYDVSIETDTVDINYQNHTIRKEDTSYDIYENGSDYYMIGNGNLTLKTTNVMNTPFVKFKGMDSNYYYEYQTDTNGNHLIAPKRLNVTNETVRGESYSRSDAVRESTLFSMNSHYGLSDLGLFQMTGLYESSLKSPSSFSIGSVPIYFGMSGTNNAVIKEEGNVITIDTFVVEKLPASYQNGEVYFNHGVYTFNDENILTSLSVESKLYDEQSFDFANLTLSENPKTIRSYKLTFSQMFGDYHEYKANEYEPKNLYFTDYTPILMDSSAKEVSEFKVGKTYYINGINPTPKIATSMIDTLTITKVSDKSIADITSDGTGITFKKAGNVVLTVYSSLNKVKKELSITVGETKPTSLKVISNGVEVTETLNLKVNDERIFSFEVLPTNAPQEVEGNIISGEGTLTKKDDGTYSFLATKEGNASLSFSAGNISKTVQINVTKSSGTTSSLTEQIISKTYECSEIEETHSLKFKSSTEAEFAIEGDFGSETITLKTVIDETKRTIKFTSFETSDYDNYTDSYLPVIKVDEEYQIKNDLSFDVYLLLLNSRDSSVFDYVSGEDTLELHTFSAK